MIYMIDWLEITDNLQCYTMNALLIITQEACDLLQFIPSPIVFVLWKRLVLKFNLNIQEDRWVAELLCIFAQSFVCLSQPLSLDSLAVLKCQSFLLFLKSYDSLHLMFKQSQGKVTPYVAYLRIALVVA